MMKLLLPLALLLTGCVSWPQMREDLIDCAAPEIADNVPRVLGAAAGALRSEGSDWRAVTDGLVRSLGHLGLCAIRKIARTAGARVQDGELSAVPALTIEQDRAVKYLTDKKLRFR